MLGSTPRPDRAAFEPTLTQPRPSSTPALAAFLGVLLLALTVLAGAAVGLAGRVVYLLGLGELILAVCVGVLAVARWHLLRERAPRWRVALWSALLAVVALSSARLADVWGLYQSQLQELQQQPEAIASDLLVAGLERPQQLLDAGLQVETGRTGLAGALLLQLKTGLVAHRSGRLERVVPMGTAAQAAVFGAEVALVALLLFRTQEQLRAQRRCSVCGRYLRREVVGGVAAASEAEAIAALQRGERPDAPLAARVAPLLLLKETCPAGHLHPPGWSLTRPRRKRLRGGAAPEELAFTPGQPDPLAE